MKPYRVEYVQLVGWEADQVGLWIAENETWLLLRHIPVDYVVDGYVLLAKKHIASRKPRKGKHQLELVLKLKGIGVEGPAGFQFLHTVSMLRWVEEQYGLVEFALEEEVAFFDWIKEADTVHFWVDMLWSDGVVESHQGKKPFILADIQIISFATYYFNSLKLLWQYKQRLRLQKPSDN